jgi:hypothetical protein
LMHTGRWQGNKARAGRWADKTGRPDGWQGRPQGKCDMPRMYGSHYALVLPNSPTAQAAAKITLIAKRRHINANPCSAIVLAIFRHVRVYIGTIIIIA